MHTVQVIIPDLDTDDPREAAKMFLSALVNADWSAGLEVCAASHGGDNVDIVTLTAKEVADALMPMDLTPALNEMRRRGAAVAIYDAGELATMFDGDDEMDDVDFEAFMAEEQDALEECMCDAARSYVITNASHDPDEEAEDY